MSRRTDRLTIYDVGKLAADDAREAEAANYEQALPERQLSNIVLRPHRYLTAPNTSTMRMENGCRVAGALVFPPALEKREGRSAISPRDNLGSPLTSVARGGTALAPFHRISVVRCGDGLPPRPSAHPWTE